jgi:hypothetical protein
MFIAWSLCSSACPLPVVVGATYVSPAGLELPIRGTNDRRASSRKRMAVAEDQNCFGHFAFPPA